MEKPFKQVYALRKEGHTEEALLLAREALSVTPEDSYLQTACGWVIYDLVRREVEARNAHRTSVSRLADGLNPLLLEYQNLNRIERPGLLHSRVLLQVLKVAREWSGFLRFARWWDLANIRSEDKEPYKTEEGKTFPSIELRLLRAIGRVAAAGGNDSELQAWAESAVDNSLTAYPNDDYLQYYTSQLLVLHGRNAEARTCWMPVVKRKQRTGWIWSWLGRTFEHDDAEKAITCYYRAIQLAGKPSEVLKTRGRLAHLLAARERFPEAARQVRTALKVREAEGWKVPEELARLSRAAWYQGLANAQDLPREPDVTEHAEVLLFGAEAAELQWRLGVIDNQNVQKALAHAAFSPTEGAVLMYREFKTVAEMAVGTIVEVRCVGEPPQPFRLRRAQNRSIPGFCRDLDGEFTQRAGQAFGFVSEEHGERVFVPPGVVNACRVPSGTCVRCRALLGEDKKRGVLGWKALSISEIRG